MLGKGYHGSVTIALSLLLIVGWLRIPLSGEPRSPVLVATAPFTCSIYGTRASETIRGTPRNDVICARGGDDHVIGRRGDDVILGGRGDDDMEAGRGDDRVDGGPGQDEVTGGTGDDRIWGRTGRERILSGDRGSDVIRAGRGTDFCLDGRDGRPTDVLMGGPGRDTYQADEGDRVMSGESERQCAPIGTPPGSR